MMFRVILPPARLEPALISETDVPVHQPGMKTRFSTSLDFEDQDTFYAQAVRPKVTAPKEPPPRTE